MSNDEIRDAPPDRHPLFDGDLVEPFRSKIVADLVVDVCADRPRRARAHRDEGDLPRASNGGQRCDVATVAHAVEADSSWVDVRTGPEHPDAGENVRRELLVRGVDVSGRLAAAALVERPAAIGFCTA
jgi:hypothetical protein